ncbi:tetratricopeptide repeat protein [uncultured Tateyamaria sp.]|uniref:tetratricopeptide repeat protein n=1 Tax=uncultured Tateyamaria sp. TaxID=455651 RepID=UPI00260C56C2|nr:tetratricopeptide repeat protein [uncultured Tateyamaria sp.]
MWPLLARNFVLAISLCLSLAACDTAEERAEKYLASALELIDQGDLDRAAIELRNVFELMANHVEARETMAQLMLDKNDKSAAYGHYLRLVEQVPDHVEGRTILAEIAFEARNWQEFVRHAAQAVALAPDAPRSQIIDLALRYQEALEARDGPARDALRDKAERLAADNPDSDVLQQVLFDAYMRDRKLDRALGQLDRMIASKPDNRTLYTQRLGLLNELQDYAAVEDQLRNMVALFADDDGPKKDLIRFYVRRNQVNKAEAFFREIADPAAEDPALFIGLVRFLRDMRDPETAHAELIAALEVSPQPGKLKMLLAMLDFEAGAHDKAITDLQALLDQATPSAQPNDIKITLAQMMIQTGNVVDAKRLVDEVLESDSRHVEGLKMRATWLIGNDATDAAIAGLRLALDKAPNDVAALTLMSQAYTRAGNRDLSWDFLALAVDASNNAPAPTLRYARVLAADERYLAAEEVLIAALRRDRSNADLLVLLGEVYLASEDYSRADQVIKRLRSIGTERTLVVANALQARLLGSREGLEQALGFLEELATREDSALNTQMTLLRARLSSDQTEKALEQAKELVAKHPENPSLQFILATSHAANGNLDVAETLLSALVQEDRNRMRVWSQLYRFQRVQQKDAEASQTLRDGLAIDPDNRDLLWFQAAEFEASGDIDSAITNYERIYERNSGDLIAANNLASLLATHKTDEDSFERAWIVARRFRDTNVPAMQDTYGWVAFRRGNLEESLPYLELAASALPSDPIVQFHLGQVYGALDRRADAIAQYQQMLELADDNDPRPQFKIARDEAARLEQLPALSD